MYEYLTDASFDEIKTDQIIDVATLLTVQTSRLQRVSTPRRRRGRCAWQPGDLLQQAWRCSSDRNH